MKNLLIAAVSAFLICPPPATAQVSPSAAREVRNSLTIALKAKARVENQPGTSLTTREKATLLEIFMLRETEEKSVFQIEEFDHHPTMPELKEVIDVAQVLSKDGWDCHVVTSPDHKVSLVVSFPE